MHVISYTCTIGCSACEWHGWYLPVFLCDPAEQYGQRHCSLNAAVSNSEEISLLVAIKDIHPDVSTVTEEWLLTSLTLRLLRILQISKGCWITFFRILYLDYATFSETSELSLSFKLLWFTESFPHDLELMSQPDDRIEEKILISESLKKFGRTMSTKNSIETVRMEFGLKESLKDSKWAFPPQCRREARGLLATYLHH